MTDHVPTTDQVRFAMAGLQMSGGRFVTRASFDRWLAAHDAQVAAKVLREFATHLDGGTPRAWGFHHPCDAPGVRWEPNETEKVIMQNADIAREAADRIEGGTSA